MKTRMEAAVEGPVLNKEQSNSGGSSDHQFKLQWGEIVQLSGRLCVNGAMDPAEGKELSTTVSLQSLLMQRNSASPP